MSHESFPPKKNTESLEARAEQLDQEGEKRYKAVPAANPRVFQLSNAEGEMYESPFVFSPIDVSVTPESIKAVIESDQYTDVELATLELGKLLNELRAGVEGSEIILGVYEMTFVMRAEGDNRHIDKMIAALDRDNPWEAGRIEHLLLLAQTNPALFDEPVAAVGTITKRKRYVPCLKNSNGRIAYDRHPRDAGFNRWWRFLIVRKKVA